MNSAHTSALQKLASPIGLVAGNGIFPLEFAKSAKERGLKVCSVLHRGETDQSLLKESDQHLWIKVGQVGAMIKFFKKSGVKQIAFAGGIRRVRLFGGAYKLDARALKLLARLKSIRDDVILRGIAEEFEREGFDVISPSLLLQRLIIQPGYFGKRELSAEEKRDAKLGWEACRAIGLQDIGQTVCVVDSVVTAVEAVEGTDAAIKRSFELSGRAGVVVKLCKPQQDLRLDLPTIGPKTIESLVLAKASALVLEADKTIVLEPQETMAAADKAGLSILALRDPADI